MSKKNQAKRKHVPLSVRTSDRGSKVKSTFTSWGDEDISSGSDDEHLDEVDTQDNENGIADPFSQESAENKRRRLAKQYLNEFSNNINEKDEDHSFLVSNKLKIDRLYSKGELFQDLSNKFQGLDINSCVRKEFRGHKSSITCLAITKDEQFVVTGSKDCSILQWNIESNLKVELKSRWKKADTSRSSESEILAVAVTWDSRYIVSGGRDGIIRVYDSRIKYSEVHQFKGHRDAVTSLAFKYDTYTLFSGSLDRCLKHWDLTEMAYIETMFGHQDAVYDVDCWIKERPISVSCDRSIRIWKIPEETHLVFRGPKSNIDNIQFLTESSFVTGCQDGTLGLWKDSQKNSVSVINAAHGFDDSDCKSKGNPRWISSIASIKMSNIFASGSNDGFVKIWTANAEDKVLKHCISIPAAGFINALAITSNILAIGSGKEHKYGRWWNLSGNHNKLTILKFNNINDSSS